LPKQRSPDSYRAEELYKSGMKLVEIASQLNVSEGTVRSWKNRYNFGEKSNATLRKNNRNVAKKKHGGQPGNKNAVGHGAPKRNKNAEKFGFFSKYLPEETVSIIQEMPADPLDVLWDQIQIAYAAIIRAQQIMYVRDRDDLTTTQIQDKNGDSVTEERWEVQQAWDKQASFLKAQARAQSELRSMIKQYDELLHKNWALASEEQKARIEVLRSKAADSDEKTESQISSYLDKLEEAVKNEPE